MPPTTRNWPTPLADPDADLVRARERDKIKGAVRTDFILSAEIIVIALGVVNEQAPFAPQVAALVAVAIVDDGRACTAWSPPSSRSTTSACT